MKNQLTLLPAPQKMEELDDFYPVLPGKLIVINCHNPLHLFHSAKLLQSAMEASVGFAWEIVVNSNLPDMLAGINFDINPERIHKPQGYFLKINRDGIYLSGNDAAGVYYGICTLAQIFSQATDRLPCLTIVDWPDFLVRGVMLDISRDKVPSMETMRGLIDLLAGWKINQFQLYTEHTFAYRNHPVVWEHATPVTGQEILELDQLCSERFVELVPNQNSFGHMQRWLMHPKYQALAEITGKFESIWGPMEGPFSLSPVVPESQELLKEMYDELLPHFTSRQFNVGCDETVDLGHGRSKKLCEEKGLGRVYLEFLKEIYTLVSERDHKMQFWGDIIINYPNLLDELPKDAIALEWGYDADHPFMDHTRKFAASGLQFYVCPGTSSWNTISGRTENAMANLHNAARNGIEYGAVGYLNTDWGDNGHWQTLPISYLGFALGAGYSWALSANEGIDIQRALDLFAFKDKNFQMGKLAYDLGNIYKVIGVEIPNSSALFWIMQMSIDELSEYSAAQTSDFERTLGTIDAIIAHLADADMQHPDQLLIKREFSLAAQMLRHACNRGFYIFEKDELRRADLRKMLKNELEQIINEYREVWLARNRPGGLVDSLGRLEKLYIDYCEPNA